MRVVAPGFLLVEVLLSLAIMTGFVAICLRYQARSMTLQAQAIKTMRLVDQIEELLDATKYQTQKQTVSAFNGNSSCVVDQVTVPSLQGSPAQFSLACARAMKVMTVTAQLPGDAQQSFRLAVIFKGVAS